MRNKGAQLSLALVCLIVGTMFGIQYKTTNFYKASLVPARIEDLTAQLNNVTGERDNLGQMVASLNQQLEDIRNSDKEMANLQKELQLDNMVGGLYPVEGPGVSITMSESPGSLQTNENSNGSIVNVLDILRLVNELRASGAEAITVNDQRITAMSEIHWSGSMIVVNQNRIAPPFHIQAIGDPSMLESGMSLKGGYLETLKFNGLQIEMKKLEKIKMAAYNGSTKMTFGKAVN
ncbi:MAG: DUF881 domain-containing protein [Syntrophomonadaceae bacterium]